MSGTFPHAVTDGDVFARTLLDAATQVEAAELALKHEILKAANAGDTRRVAELVSRWLSEPPVAVAAALIDASDPR